jgi:hypothetical protein
VSTVRSVAALAVLGAALTFAAVGIVRGTLPAGPGSGTRFTVAIAPPVDEAAQTIATHVVRDRLEERGLGDVRVLPAADKLVVEVETTDRELVAMQAELLERTGKLEVHRIDPANAWLASIAARDGIRVENGIPIADDVREELPIAEADKIGCTGRVEDGKRMCAVRGDHVLARGLARVAVPDDRVLAYGRVGESASWRPYLLEHETLLDGSQIQRADVLAGGVAITVAHASKLAVGAPIAVVFDGVVHFTGAPDRIEGALVHLPTGTDAKAAFELVSVVEAGAVHPLHVVGQTPFTRATGFFPRAWPFLAIGGALLIVGALVWWSGRRRRAA